MYIVGEKLYDQKISSEIESSIKKIINGKSSFYASTVSLQSLSWEEGLSICGNSSLGT